MNAATILTIILVVIPVWGGLIFFLSRAIKFESKKEVNGEE
jgi:hypothetical protein